MPKYFFPPNAIKGNEIHLYDKETIHHLLNVLRIKSGDKIILCDGNNTDYESVFSCATKLEVAIFTITGIVPCNNEPAVPITLYMSLPKGDKLELIIQKAVELGVSEIVPVHTARSIVKLKDGKDKKTIRLQRIAESAAGQCMRGKIPKVHSVRSFNEAVQDFMVQHDSNEARHLCLIAYEQEHTLSLKEVLCSHKPQPIRIWIGAEGGFEKREVETLVANGATPVSLGRRILRCETAAIATVAQISFFWGD